MGRRWCYQTHTGLDELSTLRCIHTELNAQNMRVWQCVCVAPTQLRLSFSFIAPPSRPLSLSLAFACVSFLLIFAIDGMLVCYGYEWYRRQGPICDRRRHKVNSLGVQFRC